MHACIRGSSVGFAPWDPHLLVYSEVAKAVRMRRVPQQQQPRAGGDACCDVNSNLGEPAGCLHLF